MNNTICAIALALAALLSWSDTRAAPPVPAPPAKETSVLQRAPIPGTDNVMGLGMAEFAPNAIKARHQHAGPEVAYVLEGDIRIEIDGQPARLVRAGESFQIPAHVTHSTRAGPQGAKVVATWVYVPGKQFNLPMPN